MHPILEPWAISEPGLQLVLAVWSRGELFQERLAGARAERGDAPLLNDTGKMVVEQGVAVIPVSGPMMRHAELFSDISGATSYARIRKDLAAGLASADARAILLRIDSPGGECNGCGELADQIYEARSKKPVIAYVEGGGCSGAYWLASAASEIVAAPSAVLGSIGVRCGVIDDSKAQEKLGVRHVEIISSQSPGKRGTPIDDEVLARIQAHADALAEVFVAAVAQKRGVSVEKVLKDFGGGGVLVGARAVAAGLADRLGSFDSVLAELRGRPSTTSGATARTGASSMKTQDDVQEIATKAELQAAEARAAAAEQKLAEVQPLLDQVADLTGKTTVAEQQGALVQLQLRAARADQLQGQLGDERSQLLAKAKAKGIPPVAMRGWERLKIETLREVVETAEGITPKQPAASQGRDPSASAVTDLSDDEFAVYRAAGAKTREEALAMKAEGEQLARTSGRRAKDEE